MRIHNIRFNEVKEGPVHPIKFKAFWDPINKKMLVKFSAGGKTHHSAMDAKDYDKWCASLDEGIKIGGWTVNFEGAKPDDPTVAAVKDYFRLVNRTFKETGQTEKLVL
jgi:hypothetical protein